MAKKPEIHDLGITEWDEESITELVEHGVISTEEEKQELRDQSPWHTLQCVDCGAWTNSGDEDKIEHRSSCTPGEAEKWKKYYEEAED